MAFYMDPLVHIEHQHIKGPEMTIVKQFKQKNQWSNLYNLRRVYKNAEGQYV